MHRVRHKQGFSLTELIVAMAIFTVLMAGLLALFSGVVKTVRQGYRFMDATEIGRSTLQVMQRDLEGSCVNTELRDAYMFYGRPEGFMFIGAHGGGQLGRVTYVITRYADADNTIDENRPFSTVVGLPWTAVRDAVVAQGMDQGVFESHYGTEPADFNVPTDFEVWIELGSVVRYEERNVSDLETFNLQGLQDPSGVAMRWPEINAYATLDEIVTVEPNYAQAGGLYNEELYKHMLSSIRQWPFIDAYQWDLRVILADQNPDRPLYALTLTTVQDLLRAKQREIWIRWLANDATLGLPSFWKGYGAGVPDPRPDVRDYILADRVVVRAILLEPDTTIPIYANNENYGNASVFNTAGYFSYMDYNKGQRQGALTWQDSANLPGYTAYMESLFPKFAILDFDAEILKSDVVGSFHEAGGPRLPCFVIPDFWVMMEEGSGQGGDYRRRFTQAIEIPSRIARAASEM